MTPNKKLLALTVSGLLLAATAGTAAAADGQGFYAGLGIGQARSELGSGLRDALAANYGSHTLAEDKNDIAGRILLGYRFGKHFALEGGYGSYGTVDGKAGTTLPLSTVTAERETNAFILDAVGILPVSERVDLTARLGAAFWRVESQVTTTLPVSQVSTRQTREKSGVAPRYGVGLQYRVAEKTRLTLDVEGFRAGKGEETGKRTVSAVFAGLKFDF